MKEYLRSIGEGALGEVGVQQSKMYALDVNFDYSYKDYLNLTASSEFEVNTDNYTVEVSIKVTKNK